MQPTASDFQPGFRFKLTDLFVLLCAGVVALLLIPMDWRLSCGIALVVAHFFLFCNVFRIARSLELIWAAVFVTLAVSSIQFGFPNAATAAALLVVTAVLLILVEILKPSYHGIGWKTLNPELPVWWNSRVHHRSSSDIRPENRSAADD